MPNRGTDLIGGISEILDLYVRSKEKERDLYKAAEKKEQQLVQVTYPDGSVRMEPRVSGMQIKPATKEEAPKLIQAEDPVTGDTILVEEKVGLTIKFKGEKDRPTIKDENGRIRWKDDLTLMLPNLSVETENKLTDQEKKLFAQYEIAKKKKAKITDPVFDIKLGVIDPTEDGSGWTEADEKNLQGMETALRKIQPGAFFELEQVEEEPAAAEVTPDVRFTELLDQGLSKEEVFQKMLDEGF